MRGQHLRREAADRSTGRRVRGRAGRRAACRGRCRSSTSPACSCRRARRPRADRSAASCVRLRPVGGRGDRPGGEAVVAAEHQRNAHPAKNRGRLCRRAAGTPSRCRGYTSAARRAGPAFPGSATADRRDRRRYAELGDPLAAARQSGGPTAPCRRRGGCPPRSSGTPMMWIAFMSSDATYRIFTDTDIPSSPGLDDGCHQTARHSGSLRENRPSRSRLLTTLCPRKSPRGSRRGMHQVEKPLVVASSRRPGTRSRPFRRSSGSAEGVARNRPSRCRPDRRGECCRRRRGRAPDRIRSWSDGRRSPGAQAQSRSRCSRPPRRSRAHAVAPCDTTITRRKRPSSSETAIWSLSAALDLL